MTWAVTAKAGTLAAALLVTSFVLPAQATTCFTSASMLTSPNSFTCTVGQLTFSNILVSTIGNVSLGNLSPFIGGDENGLSLNYLALASSSAGADVGLSYDVTVAPGFLITDAYMDVTGTVTGTGTAHLSETLSNGRILPQIILTSASTNASSMTTFPGVAFLHAIKDQADFTGDVGTSETSVLDDGFSVSPVPLPGAALLFGSGLVGLLAVGRKRKAEKPLELTAA